MHRAYTGSKILSVWWWKETILFTRSWIPASMVVWTTFPLFPSFLDQTFFVELRGLAANFPLFYQVPEWDEGSDWHRWALCSVFRCILRDKTDKKKDEESGSQPIIAKDKDREENIFEKHRYGRKATIGYLKKKRLSWKTN